MQKLQNSAILWHKIILVNSYLKDFFTIKERFSMNLYREFYFCDSTIKD